MADRQTGPDNPNWKGGRVVDPRGYVLIRVGKDHPLADVRGYAYEERLKTQEALGRQLTALEHGLRQRRGGKAKQLPDEPNPTITCACGCGIELARYDRQRRERRFLPSHNNRTRTRGSDGRML